MKSRISHVGWVTNRIDRFEDFWCKGLGFTKTWEAALMPEKTKILFGIEATATAIRYEKDTDTIEIHVFSPLVPIENTQFMKHGINHICLHVVGGSRDDFIKELSSKVQYLEVRRFHDPSGWDNIFICDYDGNWIELRETFHDHNK